MLSKQTKRGLSLQRAVAEVLSEGIRLELGNMKQLTGERLEDFLKVFSLEFPFEVEIYYNKFNILFCQEPVYKELESYFKPDSFVMKVEMPKLNTNIWVHDTSDPLFGNLFDDLVEISDLAE
jgi:hypothetical protein